ncbi:MAG: hypothetical protein IJV35_08300 [Neisseriaceae bacterium]|nr:hypothetical protein [Neisseriaceae bacterium]
MLCLHSLMGLPRLLTQSRNDTGVSGKTANACLSARNDDTSFRLPENKKYFIKKIFSSIE